MLFADNAFLPILKATDEKFEHVTFVAVLEDYDTPISEEAWQELLPPSSAESVPSNVTSTNSSAIVDETEAPAVEIERKSSLVEPYDMEFP